MKLYRCDLKQT